MEVIFVLSSILLSIAVSLGVGGSTIAIINFFVAINDGSIEPTERRMMGVTYWVLRVAMVLIALMLVTHYMMGYVGFATPYYATTHAIALAITATILYLNAIAMTYRLMPSTFGPALQASSWYTTGVLLALIPLGITSFTILVFIIAYVATFVLFLGIVNGVMGWLKHRT